MKKLVAIAVVAVTLIGFAVPAAHAGGAASAALALGAFAAFNLLFFPLWAAAAWYPPPVYAAPAPVVYTAPAYRAAPVTYSAPPVRPAIHREVVYPHGRYLIYGDGIRTAYQWVLVPNAPPPPPPPAAPPASFEPAAPSPSGAL